MLRKIKKYALTLAIFAAFSSGLVGLVNTITMSAIEKQITKKKIQLFNQIVPKNTYNNNPMNECYLLTDPVLGGTTPHHLYLARKNGALVALVVESTAIDGFSGAIELLVGIDLSGRTLGVRVIRHHETPGLGDKIDLRISDWITNFKGKLLCSDNDMNWVIKKDGGFFDQFTGATITPRAVVNSVRRTVKFLKKISTSPEKYQISGNSTCVK